MRKLSVNNSQGVRKIRKERLLQNTQSIRGHFSKILYRWLIYEHLTNPESNIFTSYFVKSRMEIISLKKETFNKLHELKIGFYLKKRLSNKAISENIIIVFSI